MAKYNEQDNDAYLLKHNLLGIDCYQELERAESFVFSLRASDFERGEFVLKDFTMEEFKKLHHFLFQDIYTFAGEFRDVQLMKGNTRFCQVQFLNDNALELFHQLKIEKSWRSLDEAALRLAYFKSELNMLHPFREGNGRTIRIFLHAYAKSQSIEWSYEEMDSSTYIQAMIESVVNIVPLKELYLETIDWIW